MNPRQFLGLMASTASALDPHEHMNLISKYAGVFGVPGFDKTGHDDWFKQCKHEFENRLLKQVS